MFQKRKKEKENKRKKNKQKKSGIIRIYFSLKKWFPLKGFYIII